jgi:CRISPR-associated protein Cas2
MGASKNWYLICYDIREPKRWRKAHKLLQGYGQTVQYSIFRCWLTQREREQLRWELEKILVKEDNLLIVGLCHRCIERVQLCNRPDSWAEPGECYRVI